VKCACICNCTKEADDDVEPKLCTVCRLCESLDTSAKPKHGLPYVPTVWPKLEPPAPITKEQKDRAIETAMEGLI
jgi:hypothetical protein